MTQGRRKGHPPRKHDPSGSPHPHGDTSQHVLPSEGAIPYDDSLQKLLDIVPDPLVIVDRNGTIAAANRWMTKLFGYDVDELVGRPLSMLLPERCRASHAGRMEAFFAEPRTRPMGTGLELFGLRKDGTEFPVDISLNPVATDDTTLAVAATVRDATPHKKMEALLKEEAKVLEAITAGRPLEETAVELCAALERFFADAHAAVFLLDDGGAALRLLASSPGAPDIGRMLEGVEPHTRRGPVCAAALEGRAEHSTDIAADDRWPPHYRDLALSCGYRSCFSHPVLSRDGTPRGVVVVLRRSTWEPSDRDRGVIERAAHVVAVAVEKRRAEEELEKRFEQLEKKKSYESIVRTVIEGIHSSLELDAILHNAVRAIVDNVERVDCAAIYMVEGDEAVLKAHVGYPEWFVRRTSIIPRGRGLTWRTILDAAPRCVGRIGSDDPIGPAGRELGTKSYISPPYDTAARP